LIGLIRRECLDHIVVFGERHLRHVLLSYMDYYNRASEHPSGYVIDEKRFCWLGCDRAGYFGFCCARSVMDMSPSRNGFNPCITLGSPAMRLKWKLLGAGAALGVLALGYFGFSHYKGGQAAPPQAVAPPVTASKRMHRRDPGLGIEGFAPSRNTPRDGAKRVCDGAAKLSCEAFRALGRRV
jgi:hypothetical protein